MPKNIKEIRLWNDNPQKDRISNVVRIEFNFPCTWTILDIEDLKKIIRLWIEGEELKYPRDKDIGLHVGELRGRGMLFEEIKKLFELNLPKKEKGE
jgi:hypothetical protein